MTQFSTWNHLCLRIGAGSTVGDFHFRIQISLWYFLVRRCPSGYEEKAYPEQFLSNAWKIFLRCNVRILLYTTIPQTHADRFLQALLDPTGFMSGVDLRALLFMDPRLKLLVIGNLR